MNKKRAYKVLPSHPEMYDLLNRLVFVYVRDERDLAKDYFITRPVKILY